MPAIKMTDRGIAGLRPSKRTVYLDSATPGLALRVGAKGKSRSWFFVYRNGGPQEWLRLGQYPALKLAKARGAALDARKQIEIDGVDPAVERRTPAPPVEPTPEPPRAYTFADFAPVFVQFQQQQNVRDWKSNQGQIERHLMPLWRDRPLA
jgi:hypothetical protein